MNTTAESSLAGEAIPFVTWQSDGTRATGASVAVIAVHGRGQSPAFMAEQALRFAVSGVKFYAPHAPDDTWYPLGFTVPLAENEPKLSASLNTVASLVHTVMADGYALDQIVLWGFSQGACLLTQFAIDNPESYGGLLIFTGGYLGPHALSPAKETPLVGVPVVMRSVDDDPWVPKTRVEETAEFLRSAGAVVNLQIDEGDVHGITDEAIATGASLLNSLVTRFDKRVTNS